MTEPIKQPQNDTQPIQPKAQPSQQPPAPPKATWRKNSLKNLLYLASLMGLVSLLFWLVIPTNQPATLAQVTPVGTAFEFPITQTITPQVTPPQTPEPIPTNTTDYSQLPFPMPSPIGTTEHGDYIYNFPPYIETFTPSPVVTPMPTPVPVLKVIDNQKLNIENLRPFSSWANLDAPTSMLFNGVGWTENGDVVFQEQNLIELDGTYLPQTLYHVGGTWLVSPLDGLVQPESNWKPLGTVTVIAFGSLESATWIIDHYQNEGISKIDWLTIPGWTESQQQLAEKWSNQMPIIAARPQHWQAASDGKTVILHVAGEKLYVFRPNYDSPITLPTNQEGFNRQISANLAQVSPDGNKVVYGVRVSSTNKNTPETTYEIEVVHLDNNSVKIIELEYKFGYPQEFAWSYDSEFIAHTAQPTDHAYPHIYVIRVNDQKVTDLTPTSLGVALSLHWNPQQLKLLYLGGNPAIPESMNYSIMTLAK